jgi:hypothetical protein
MSFLLCHDCYTWVEPEENRCPECLLVMDLSESDPPSALLRELMGDIVDGLGEVRIPRKLLPEWGTLYATTNGLFFVPHETEDSLSADAGAFRGNSLMGNLGSLLCSPLLFLRPLIRGEFSRKTSLRVFRPRHLTEADSLLLPELLMENPGAFFLPKRQIRTVYRKRSRWVIERSLGNRLRFSPVGPAKLFQEKFITLFEAPAWRGVGS